MFGKGRWQGVDKAIHVLCLKTIVLLSPLFGNACPLGSTFPWADTLLSWYCTFERLSWQAPWNWTDLTHDPTNIGRRLESSWHNTLIAGASFVNWDVGAGEVVEWHSRGLPSEKWESLRMMTWKVFRIHAHGHGGVSCGIWATSGMCAASASFSGFLLYFLCVFVVFAFISDSASFLMPDELSWHAYANTMCSLKFF